MRLQTDGMRLIVSWHVDRQTSPKKMKHSSCSIYDQQDVCLSQITTFYELNYILVTDKIDVRFFT